MHDNLLERGLGNLGWFGPDGLHHVVHFDGSRAWITACGCVIGVTRSLTSAPHVIDACPSCVLVESEARVE